MKDPYVYEDTGTLINKLGIKDYYELRQAEADISFVKLLDVDDNVDCTKLDLEYIKNIHNLLICFALVLPVLRVIAFSFGHSMIILVCNQ